MSAQTFFEKKREQQEAEVVLKCLQHALDTKRRRRKRKTDARTCRMHFGTFAVDRHGDVSSFGPRGSPRAGKLSNLQRAAAQARAGRRVRTWHLERWESHRREKGEHQREHSHPATLRDAQLRKAPVGASEPADTASSPLRTHCSATWCLVWNVRIFTAPRERKGHYKTKQRRQRSKKKKAEASTKVTKTQRAGGQQQSGAQA